MKKISYQPLLLTFLILFAGGNVLWTQSPIADSLRIEIDQTSDPRLKAELYKKQAREVLGFSVDSSIMIIHKALAIGQELEDKEIIGSSLIWLGRTLGEKNLQDSALLCFAEAETIFSNPIDSLQLAEIYNGRGIIFKYQQKLEEAIALQIKSASIYESLGMDHKAASTYNSIANIHSSSKNFKKAGDFFEKAIELLKAQNSPRALAGALFNYATILEEGSEKQLNLYREVEKIALQNNYNRLLSYIYSGLANYHHEKGITIDSSRIYFQKGMEHAELSGDSYMHAYNQLFLGIIESGNRPKEAEQKILNSLENEYIQQDIFLRAKGNDHLAQSLFLQGKYKTAYIKLDTAQNLYEKVFNQDIITTNANMSAKYETAKKEAQLNQQKLEIEQQENRQNRIIAIGLALLATIIALSQYFFYRQKRKKQKAELALLSEQKKAKRLREVDQLKNTFFTNISHELRTPLTLVAAPLEDALESVKPGLLQNHLQLAQSNTKKLLNLVNEILDLSKLEAGKIESKNSEINLLSFSRRVFYSFESIAQIRDITLIFESTIADSINIETDVEKLEKILNNLLSNAFKFTDAGGSVTFMLHQNKGGFSFTVKDTGSGIAPEELPRIFDRFYQSTASNAPLHGGSGIGLALAKELAQLLHGDLQVESSLGKGSQFMLNLPLKEKRASEGSIEPESNQEAAIQKDLTANINFTPLLLNGQKPRLLIVEDNPEMSQYLVQSLSQQYHCTTAPDGKAALKKLQDQNFDLITSDVMMPQMDGFAFREKVNEHIGWRQIPFIMLTARTLEEDKLKGFQLGVDDYLTKPFSLKELKARVHNLLLNKLARDSFEEEENEEPVPSADEKLLKEVEAYVLKRLDDPQLRVDDLAQAVNFSSRHLSRVLRKLCGLTPVNFILELRLQKARQLLESKRFQSVAEVRYEIGIESASYFTTKFTERFGKNPKEYLS